MRVLIAEDDEHTRRGLAEILEAEGYTPVGVDDGLAALDEVARRVPDFVCLDVMMPGADGYTVCREMRRRHPELPILFISAKGEEVDKVVGLELGADDYIVKPFGMREVIARIRAITRRCLGRASATRAEQPFPIGGVTVYPSELRARRDGETIDLSLRDVRLLELFYMNPGKALDRTTIFRHVWGEDYFPSSRTLDQHIAQLRKRIERDPRRPTIIRTVHGVGYRYDEDDARSERTKRRR
jgi:DNA-binding response OmpR family regulator